MKNELCPICEQRVKAEKEKEIELAKTLMPTKRVLQWIIDRDNEKEGPQLWAQPWTLDKKICKLGVDKKTGECLDIDDPDNGYDIDFEKEGTGQSTKYLAERIARHASPLSSDEVEAEKWLKHIIEHPIPSTLNFFSYEHIAKVYLGNEDVSLENEEEIVVKPEVPVKEDKKEEIVVKPEVPVKEDKKEIEPEKESEQKEITWETLQNNTVDELKEILSSMDFDISGLDGDEVSKEELQDIICSELNIVKEVPKKKSFADKLKDIRKNG